MTRIDNSRSIRAPRGPGLNAKSWQTEAPLLVKPFLAGATRSELMAIMVGGFANIASGVLVAYTQFLKDYVPDVGGHLAAAGKPLRTAPYRDFPRPGVVIGDQVGTDGILARRLDYAFVLYDPRALGAPAGPRLMGAWGRLVRPLLYTRDG